MYMLLMLKSGWLPVRIATSLIAGLYRPQSMTDNNEFKNDFIQSYDKISVRYDNIAFLGDLNYDLLSKKQKQTLESDCDICDLENVVKPQYKSYRS